MNWCELQGYHGFDPATGSANPTLIPPQGPQALLWPPRGRSHQRAMVSCQSASELEVCSWETHGNTCHKWSSIAGNIIYDTGRIYLQMKKSNTEIDYIMISFGGIPGIHGLWRIKALKYCTIHHRFTRFTPQTWRWTPRIDGIFPCEAPLIFQPAHFDYQSGNPHLLDLVGGFNPSEKY